MKRLAVILFALALMAVSSSAMAYDFSSIPGSTTTAAHVVEPDFLGGPNWVGALWDCWAVNTDLTPNAYSPNYWGPPMTPALRTTSWVSLAAWAAPRVSGACNVPS